MGEGGSKAFPGCLRHASARSACGRRIGRELERWGGMSLERRDHERQIREPTEANSPSRCSSITDDALKNDALSVGKHTKNQVYRQKKEKEIA